MFLVTLLVINVIIVILFKLYMKLTTGICKSSKHLVGKVVIVTGSNTGIGFETARNLAERGAKVILACRNREKAITARDSIIASTGNKNVEYQQLDLSSLASVRKFAEDIIENEKHLDILINNAGILDSKNVKTEDGLSFAMQTNHFGPFLLTSLLLPLLKSSAPSRIVNVSSLYHLMGKIDFENLNNEKETDATYNETQVYKNSKLCNVLMTVELAKRLEGTGVTTNSLHPGAVATDIVRSEGSWKRIFLPLAKYILKSPWEGAQTTIYAAVAPELNNVTGKYFSDCKEARIAEIAKDESVARKLWEMSESLVGLKTTS